MGGTLMLPNMASTLVRWQEPFTIKTLNKSTVDFVPSNTVTPRTQDCVIQVASKENLSLDTLNWSLEYLMVHSSSQLAMGEFVEFEGQDFKIVSLNNYGRYGYWEAVAEETKEALL